MPNRLITALARWPGKPPQKAARPAVQCLLDGRYTDGPYPAAGWHFTEPDWVLVVDTPEDCRVYSDGLMQCIQAPWPLVAEHLRQQLPGTWLAGYLGYALAEQAQLGADHRPANALPGALIAGYRSPRALPPTSGAPGPEDINFYLTHAFTPRWTQAEYHQAFRQVVDYILAGDVYQINLTQCLTATYEGDLKAVFNALVRRFRAPFSGFIHWQDKAVLSFSPERFLRIRAGRVQTRPIKGTRPRQPTDTQADQSLAEQLCKSEKDQAENLMIVDLLRNDLGRYCLPGTITVPELFSLESYSNVHHLVSTVEGTLRPGVSALEVLAGCSPGGSITGAPKHRAMEIIRELEPVQRGVYCGSLFYMTPDGDLDSSIAIRTVTAAGHTLEVWGGGGVVADSDCDAEYEESLTKIRHILRAITDLSR